MSTSKKNEQVATVSGQPVDVSMAADHAAVEALAPRNIIVETDWFELIGIRVKAVKVAPSIYQAARSHLRAMMRKNAPKPPTQKGPDGKLKENPFHPGHIKAMAQWEDLYQDIDDDLFFSVAILAGLEVHSDDMVLIPPPESWLASVEAQLRAIGVELETSSEYLMYGGDLETLYMLLFKKYFLLNDAETFKAFMAFQKSPVGEGVPAELLTRHAADMFRDQTGD